MPGEEDAEVIDAAFNCWNWTPCFDERIRLIFCIRNRRHWPVGILEDGLGQDVIRMSQVDQNRPFRYQLNLN